MYYRKESLMNLLEMLTGAMTNQSSVDALAKKSGTSASQTGSFISQALPILINQLTQNASSQEGARSLAGALTQHTDTSSIMQQFMNADTADGGAIIQHILGGNTQDVVSALAQQNGMNNNQAESLLDNMAPALMSGLSAAQNSARGGRQSGGFDFSGLISMFTGGDLDGTGNIVGNLMDMFTGNASQQDNGGVSGMLGKLMGMGASGKTNSGNDGSDLISSLLGLLN